jgi:hypothetical protein
MTPHKWAKEIKAWADGAEIESREHEYANWKECVNPIFDYEYRIKSQPKAFKGFKEIPYKHWVLRFYQMPNDLWYSEGMDDAWMQEMVEASKPQPKEPQYLYVYEHEGNGISFGYKPHGALNMWQTKIIGKIKLEAVDGTDVG